MIFLKSYGLNIEYYSDVLIITTMFSYFPLSISGSSIHNQNPAAIVKIVAIKKNNMYYLKKVDKDSTSWILKDINTTMNFYGDGNVFITPRGSLHIGRITMQRKGGTPDPTKIQFKFKPCELFEIA